MVRERALFLEWNPGCATFQCPEAPHPLLPAQPVFVQQPQQHLLLVQQQQQPLGQPQLLPEPEPQPQPDPQPQPQSQPDPHKQQLQLPQPQPGLPEPEPQLQLSGKLLQHEALSKSPPLSQLPAGGPPALCQPVPLPAHPAFSSVMDLEGSWTLSFLLSWGGRKEGTGPSASLSSC